MRIRMFRRHIRVSAFCYQHYPVALSAARQPVAYDPLASGAFRLHPVRIDMRCINNAAAHIQKCVEDPVRICSVPGESRIDRAKSEGMERKICIGDRDSVFHQLCLLFQNLSDFCMFTSL